MTDKVLTSTKWPRQGDLDKKAFATDLADLLWSHGFTRHQCIAILDKWLFRRAEMLAYARAQLEALPWDHHAHLDDAG